MMLILPMTAAQCERGFSAQNRIKTTLEAVCTYLPRRILLESALRDLLWRDLIQANAQRSGCLQVNVKKKHTTKPGQLKYAASDCCSLCGRNINCVQQCRCQSFKRTVHPKMKIVIICSPSCHSNILSLFHLQNSLEGYF